MVNDYFDTTSTTTNVDRTFDIYDILGRNAKDLYIINDGSHDIFVKVYTGVKSSKRVCLASGYWIDHGKMYCFHDVYKILVAKTVTKNQYHITESKYYYLVDDIYITKSVYRDVLTEHKGK